MASDRTPSPSCPVVATFDPLAHDFVADPFASMRALRVHQHPVLYAPSIGYYVVSRHEDIEAVLRDPETFSAGVVQEPLSALSDEARAILAVDGAAPRPSMVALDGEEHDRLRRPTSRAFTVRRVTDMEPLIRSTARALLDAVDRTRPFDVVSSLAFPLPASTIFNLIGIPEADHGLLKDWCGRRAALFWGRPDAAEQLEIATNIAANRDYLARFVASRHQQRGDDLTSALLATHDADPERLTLAEISSILFSLMFAGHETTTSLISNAVLRLLEVPGRWHELAADPGLAPLVVEETLRFDTSVPIWRRITTRPATVGGVEIPAGSRVLLWLAAAGRDPSRVGSPDDFDIRRSQQANLAFGLGAHYCLGAALARVEARIALEELARRFPTLTLLDRTVSYPSNLSFRGPSELIVTAGPDA